MNEVRCPYCDAKLADRLLGTVTIFCRRCKRVITATVKQAA